MVYFESGYLTKLYSKLTLHGVRFENGLSDDEVTIVESKFGFRFPPDLREFLQWKLPVSNGFPNWRNADISLLQSRLNWPVEGICFDIENNHFWLDEWGQKPYNLQDAFEIAKKAIAESPTLIPIYIHRYIPAEPSIAGNPVFSVYQTDIIYYGFDLESYFNQEFGGPKPNKKVKNPRPIKFWDLIVG